MYHKVHTDVHNLSFVMIYTLLSAYYKFSLQYYIPVHASEPLVLFYVINSLLYVIEKKMYTITMLIMAIITLARNVTPQ